MATLQQHLETLRTKPEHIRRRYAFWGAFGITFFIFAFWLGSKTSLGLASQPVIASTVNRVESPGSSLVASVGSFFNDVTSLVFGPRKITYSTIEVLPGKQ